MRFPHPFSMELKMVLNTRVEHAPVSSFQHTIGDVGHFTCTHVVESDAAVLTLNVTSTHNDPVGWVLCGWFLLDCWISEHL